ncbi:hypothetical protein CNMCM8980_008241 [Aspergillus fumigatiaffinis]|uniref:BRO1 domain-containing protein n=1 Tax=Aspergillus fumigatiaffinis TaxID=340414 RepID=A0A8H4GS10_9EURO|nr:hypothetical protein CNMCM5878_005542 [Aspergillus fumigatiaffinis]KAF4227065.1 hypothetical protein CNMCM6457_007433 [Aspergillus fumigatiaffinis]KAF4240738.1 hypothetical protein CNMCM6805_004864 [Aspergillus fumigatiaffinis]KAF4246731.1 hypothetical protein CNMCM8980_008241 [Aspergillus fumigatiaffinis]
MRADNTWTMDDTTRNKLLKKYKTQVASATSTICATLSVTPLENIKTRMQTHNFQNVFQCVRYLWRTEGPRGYVAGALPPLASVTAVRVVNFSTYNAAKHRISEFVERITGESPLATYNTPGSSPTVSTLLTFTTAGFIAGLITSPLACPFELAKNVVQTSVLVSHRSQASPDAVRDPSLRNQPRLGTIEAIRQIVRRYGFRGLYTGFHLHAMRDTIGSGLYFSVYETVKQVAAKELGPDKSPFGGPMIAGAICSTVPWFCTYPLDTRKTRAQSVLLGKSKEVGEASAAVSKSSMYKGLSIILIRTGVNNMILLIPNGGHFACDASHASTTTMTSNILQVPFRRSHAISLSDAITQYISSKYDQRPDMFADDLLIIDRLRNEAINVQEPHVSGISRLVTYAAQLKWLGGKFPVDVGVEFPWYPAFGFNTTRPISQNNLRFELANILFNLAALYSQLAFSVNRTTSDGLKQACNYFCQSAGVLLHLRADVLPDLRTSPPEDMDEMTLQSLEQLLLAQAQECFWQKAVKDGLKDASIARLAAKVSDFYAEAGDYAVKSNAISPEWIHHMTAKHHHFAAAAQYRQSLDCLEKRKYGEEVARLRDSEACVNEALKESRWINRAVLGDLNGLKSRVSEDLKRATKDNDVIYLNPVPPKSELKIIDRACMVAAKAPSQVTDAISMLGENGPLGQPLFAKLVPYAVHIAASIYSDRRDRLVNERIIGELETMTDKLRDLLSSLNLPGSLQALEKPLGLPPTLVAHAEEMRQQDGLHRLRRSLEDIAKVKANDKAVYNEGVELLAAEKAEDDASRRKYGTDRWTRQTSEAAAPKLYTTSSEISGYFTSAQSSDNLVEQKLRDSEAVFRVLTGTNRDLEMYVPSSRRAAIPPEVERELVRLRGCLSEVSRLESRRKRRAQVLKEKARADDITQALLKETARLEREFPMQPIQASQFEDLFEEQLHLYDTDLEMVAQEQHDQDQIAAQVREANRAFTRAHKGDASTKEREKALQELENGYLKYKEIISNIEVGRKFYNDLAKIVGRFRDDCKAFVHQRRMEASQLESDIASAAAMASLNISQPHLRQQPQPPHQPQLSSPPAPVQPPVQVQPSRPPEEPLTAPQPTRAPVAPPAVPTPGMWSPEMGIRFGGGNSRGQPGQWDPSDGIRFG